MSSSFVMAPLFAAVGGDARGDRRVVDVSPRRILALMTGLTPYLSFDGTARDALEFYRGVFGGELVLATFGEFGRDDGPADHIAHGMLQVPSSCSRRMPRAASRLWSSAASCSPCWAAEPAVLEEWFAALADRAATCSTRSPCDPGVTTTVRCATGSG
jgi:PhnB protein